MKSRIVAHTIAFVGLFPCAARADWEWGGVQTLTSVSTQLHIHKNVSLQGSVAVFWIPSTGKNMVFIEAGVGADWLPKGDLWSSLKIGVVSNWMGDGRDAFILSMSSGGQILNKRLSGFALVEVYLSGSQRDVYGFYRADYNAFLGRINVGLHVEHVNGRSVAGGPHIGTTVGPAQFEAQMFTDPFVCSQTVRWVTTLSF